MKEFKRDCIFYDEYRDHGATIPVCSLDSQGDLCRDIERLENCCPCYYYLTKDMLLKSKIFCKINGIKDPT